MSELLQDFLPDIERHTSYDSRRLYVEDRMRELAEAGKLRLTDLFALPQPFQDMAGEVILGRFLADRGDGGRAIDPAEVPEAIYNMKVRLRTLPGATEMYEPDAYAEPVEMPWSIKCKLPAKQIPRVRVTPAGQYEPFTELEPRSFDARDDPDKYPDPCDVVLPARTAWWVLKQSGRNCRRAVRRNTQRAYWKCEEVAIDAPPRTAKKRRGRPPKSASSEAVAQ